MILPSLNYERALWQRGVTVVAGVDEVGRGAWAGPVVAAAVVLPPDCCLSSEVEKSGARLPEMLRDSKQLSPAQRQQLEPVVKAVAESWAIGLVDVPVINEIGIGRAAFQAMTQALSQLPQPHQQLLIDGFPHPQFLPGQQQAIVKGDALVASIAAASVIAKVYRDHLLAELAHKYPEYQFDIHKGYGTRAHQAAIRKHGLSPVHRTGFKLKFLEN